MFCIICGTENPDYARFCRKCGRLVSEKPESAESVQQEAATVGHSDLSPAPIDQLKVDEFAQHYKRLSTDELISVSTHLGDLLPEARIALAAELRIRPNISPPSEGVPYQRLPYRWGKFQGWGLLVVGVLAAIPLIAWFFGVPLDENSKGYIIVSPLVIASGYAFVRRKKYAVVMPYLWIGVLVLNFLLAVLVGVTDESLTPEQKGQAIGKGLAEMIVSGVFWGSCAVYYWKRRSEFAAERSSKSTGNSRSQI